MNIWYCCYIIFLYTYNVFFLFTSRFILSAVTPAVIVPCMIKLSEEGYGMDKGIPTLVIAASSVDDVLAISGFGVLMGITFAEGVYFEG